MMMMSNNRPIVPIRLHECVSVCLGVGDYNEFVSSACIRAHPLSFITVFHDRSHDDYVTGKNGFLEPVPGSNYASQRTVFDDLGQGVLNNAFEGLHSVTALVRTLPQCLQFKPLYTVFRKKWYISF